MRKMYYIYIRSPHVVSIDTYAYRDSILLLTRTPRREVFRKITGFIREKTGVDVREPKNMGRHLREIVVVMWDRQGRPYYIAELGVHVSGIVPGHLAAVLGDEIRVYTNVARIRTGYTAQLYRIEYTGRFFRRREVIKRITGNSIVFRNIRNYLLLALASYDAAVFIIISREKISVKGTLMGLGNTLIGIEKRRVAGQSLFKEEEEDTLA